MEFMDTIIALVKEYAIWYIAPFYLMTGFYVALVLGWFFSTDYYDKIYESCDTGDDDFIFIHIAFWFIFACIGASLAVGGITGTGTLVIATGMWLFLILPYIVHYLLVLRKYLRKKRGKPL